MISDGTQTIRVQNKNKTKFESDVISDGTQTPVVVLSQSL